MKRIGYDFAQFHMEKDKLPKPDGRHCIICGAALKHPDKRRKYCSDECYTEWYESLGIRDWSVVRAGVIKRDGACMMCGSIDKLEVHHVIPIFEGGDEFDPGNCITVCGRCHKMQHNTVGNKIRKNESLEEFK